MGQLLELIEVGFMAEVDEMGVKIIKMGEVAGNDCDLDEISEMWVR